MPRSPRAAGPRAEGIHIRQIPIAHVTTDMWHFHAWVILKPTIKSYMSHYISNWAISSVSTTQRMHQRDQRNNSPGLHSDVHWCTFKCSPGKFFFDMPFDSYTLGLLKKQGYMAYVSLWIPLIWGVKVLHILITSRPWSWHAWTTAQVYSYMKFWQINCTLHRMDYSGKNFNESLAISC